MPILIYIMVIIINIGKCTKATGREPYSWTIKNFVKQFDRGYSSRMESREDLGGQSLPQNLKKID